MITVAKLAIAAFLNVVLHTFYAGNGAFNVETPDDYAQSFIAAIAIYVVMVSVITTIGAFLRTLSSKGLLNRFLAYNLYFQVFLLVVQAYQIIVDGLF